MTIRTKWEGLKLPEFEQRNANETVQFPLSRPSDEVGQSTTDLCTRTQCVMEYNQWLQELQKELERAKSGEGCEKVPTPPPWIKNYLHLN